MFWGAHPREATVLWERERPVSPSAQRPVPGTHREGPHCSGALAPGVLCTGPRASAVGFKPPVAEWEVSKQPRVIEYSAYATLKLANRVEKKRRKDQAKQFCVSRRPSTAG